MTSELGEANAPRRQGSPMLLPDFAGTLLAPGEPAFEDARRVFNGLIDRVPALIAQCTSTRDICAALRFAIEGDYEITVRGGGHSVAGHCVCDGGMMIDLSSMRAVEVDAARGRARVGPGARWRDVDRATGRFGLATPGGVVSTTGVAGFTLGGGIGWLSRRLGLACDNLVAADVVLVSGDAVRASAEQDAELLWGLRGGGGNFGVVTALEFALHPVRRVLGAVAVYDAADAGSVLAHYRSVMDDVDDTVAAIIDFATSDDGGERPLVSVVGCSVKTDEDGERVMRRLIEVEPASGRDATTHVLRSFPYPAWQQLLDRTAPAGRLNYWKSVYLDELCDEVLELICELGRTRPSSWSRVHVIRLAGRPPSGCESATAFSGRAHEYVVHLITTWSQPTDTERCTAWTVAAADRLRPFAAQGAYLNFVGDEGTDRIVDSFGATNYARLAALKERADPHNRLRGNHNVAPAATVHRAR
jgi:FAD/FMN-containing dehydrogenase